MKLLVSLHSRKFLTSGPGSFGGCFLFVLWAFSCLSNTLGFLLDVLFPPGKSSLSA